MLSEFSFKKKLLPNKIEEIKYLEGKGNYTVFFFSAGKTKTFSHNLQKFQKLLSGYNLFIRIHRSYLVNKALIKSVDFKAEYLKIETNDALPISKHFFSELEDIIKNKK